MRSNESASLGSDTFIYKYSFDCDSRTGIHADNATLAWAIGVWSLLNDWFVGWIFKCAGYGAG